LPQRNSDFYSSTERYALNVIALEKSGAMAFRELLKFIRALGYLSLIKKTWKQAMPYPLGTIHFSSLEARQCLTY